MTPASRARCLVLMLTVAIGRATWDAVGICLLKCPEGEIIGDHHKMVTINNGTTTCVEWALHAATGQLLTISDTVTCEIVQKMFFEECCGGYAYSDRDEDDEEDDDEDHAEEHDEDHEL
jgi:hypothetical protein